MTTDRDSTCPATRMDPLAREFLAKCHAEAHHRSVKAGQPPVPCLHCGRDYPWHVLEGVYWREGPGFGFALADRCRPQARHIGRRAPILETCCSVTDDV